MTTWQIYARTVIVIVNLMSLGLLPVTALANPLDGMRFIGPTGEKGEEAYGDEELTFYDGKLYSVDCAR